MKTHIIIIFCFISLNLFSQKNDTLYFLIDKKDTLITKLTNSTNGKHIGYRIIDEKRIKKLNKTPLTKNKVWVPENDDDFRSFGPSFSFDSSKSSIISQSYLNTLKIIRDRRAFLSIDKLLFDYSIFFIEPTEHNEKFILRKVYPILYD